MPRQKTKNSIPCLNFLQHTMTTEENKDVAREKIVEIIIDVKSAFENLDKIIEDIDRKNNHYMKNAAARAKFELSSGTNQEGKINTILRYLSEYDDEDG